MTRNDGKVAIVTGASRGIGAPVAERLASEGFTVIVNLGTSFGHRTPADPPCSAGRSSALDAGAGSRHGGGDGDGDVEVSQSPQGKLAMTWFTAADGAEIYYKDGGSRWIPPVLPGDARNVSSLSPATSAKVWRTCCR